MTWCLLAWEKGPFGKDGDWGFAKIIYLKVSTWRRRIPYICPALNARLLFATATHVNYQALFFSFPVSVPVDGRTPPGRVFRIDDASVCRGSL